MHKSALIIAVAAVVAACSNGGQRDVAVPLPEAYPRAYVYPDSFRTVTFRGVTFDVNAGARVDSAENGINIVYPRYGAVVYVSVHDKIKGPEAFSAEWTGRQRRIAMNLGASAGSASTDGGVREDISAPYTIVRANTTVQTPVQILTGNAEKGVIISAAAFMESWSVVTPYDSIKPVTDALERDLRHVVFSARYGDAEN